MKKIGKFFLILSYHLILALLAFAVAQQIYVVFTGFYYPHWRFLLTVLAVYSFIYFILMWKDLYTFNYHSYLRFTSRIVIKNTLIASLASLMYYFSVVVSLGPIIVPLSTVFLFFAGIGVGYIFLHFLQYLWIRILSQQGYFSKNCLLVGQTDTHLPIEQIFQDHGTSKQFIGYLQFNNEFTLFRPFHNPDKEQVLEDYSECVLKNNIGEIIFFLGKGLPAEKLEKMTAFCRMYNIGYYIVPDFSYFPKSNYWTNHFSYIPVIDRYSTSRDSLSGISLKRMADILISAIAIFALLPLGLLIALLIKLEDRGPIFYISWRIGKARKKIRFYKFRSMVPNADKLKSSLLQFNERKDGPLFKMKRDPRATRIGQVLRKTCLDELPQFINVLKGDLSIVGPRPHLPEEVSEYTKLDYLRLECIPGITCFPQIIDKDGMEFREWVDHDLNYRRQWNILLDFKLMWETFKVVILPAFLRKKKKEKLH